MSLLPLRKGKVSDVEPVVSLKSESGCARDGYFFALGGRVSNPKSHWMDRGSGSTVNSGSPNDVTSTARKHPNQFCELKKQV